MIKERVAVAVVALLAVLFSCSPPESATKKIEIADIGWVLENVDTSLWTDGFNSATSFGWFDIVYTGDALTLSDIEYARVGKAGSSTSWSFPIDSTHVDLTKGHLHSNLNYDTSANGSTFPIGSMVFEVGLSNGSKATYSRDIPAPGQTSSNSNNAVYNEDFLGSVGGDYVPMLKRPICTAQSKGASISITFHSNDPAFFNGYVTFYDSSHNEVGVSPYFKNYNVLSAFVNGGLQFHSDGTDNVLTLQPSSITYQQGRTYADIFEYIVVLTDGYQYLTSAHDYDCLAFGRRTAF